MTKNETGAIIAMINAAYPRHFDKVADVDLLVDLWSGLLGQYSSEQVTAALKKYMLNDTKGFGPSPGQLVDLIDRAQHPDDLGEGEAWALVYRAGCRALYYADEEYAALPAVIQKVLGSPRALREIAMASEESVSVIESNFKRAYRQELHRAREDRKVTPDVRRMLEQHDRKELEG